MNYRVMYQYCPPGTNHPRTPQLLDLYNDLGQATRICHQYIDSHQGDYYDFWVQEEEDT